MADDALALSGSCLWDDATPLSASNLLLYGQPAASTPAISDREPSSDPFTPPAFSAPPMASTVVPDDLTARLPTHRGHPYSTAEPYASDSLHHYGAGSPPAHYERNPAAVASPGTDLVDHLDPPVSASASAPARVSPLSAALSAVSDNIPTDPPRPNVPVSPSRSKRSSRRMKPKKHVLKSSINIFDKLNECTVIPDSSNPLLSPAAVPDRTDEDEDEHEEDYIVATATTTDEAPSNLSKETQVDNILDAKRARGIQTHSKFDKKSTNEPPSLISSAQSEYTIGESLQDPSLLVPYPEIPLAESLDIVVGDPINVGDIRSAHTVYTVHTTKPSKLSDSDDEARVSIVTRRYRDFRWLFHILQDNHPGVFIPPPPEKQRVGRFNEEFIEHRRQFLNNMLRKIANHPLLFQDENFISFLFNDSFNLDIKHSTDDPFLDVSNDDDLHKQADHDSGTDTLTDSGDSTDQYDSSSSSQFGKINREFNRLSHEATAVLSASKSLHAKSTLSGSSSGHSGGGLLRIFSGNNFREFDNWFDEKRVVIDALETQLKGLHRSLELILNSRQELVNNLNDFSIIMARFSITAQDLLNNNKSNDKSLNELVENFSATLHKIQQIYSDQRENNYFQLKMKIEEYLRIIQHSIRKSFLQRENFWHYNIQTDESTLQKQLRVFEKLRKRHSESFSNMDSSNTGVNQSDSTRIEKLKLLIKGQEKKLIDDNRKFSEITLTIKREFDRFEVLKVIEFGDTVEKFVNEAIKSQVKAIETWETFYRISGF